jgi:hypothetical protein
MSRVKFENLEKLDLYKDVHSTLQWLSIDKKNLLIYATEEQKKNLTHFQGLQILLLNVLRSTVLLLLLF